MKKIFNNEVALVYKNGKFCDIVDSGKYPEMFGKEYCTRSKIGELSSDVITCEDILSNKKTASKVLVCECLPNEVIVHYVNDVYEGTYYTEGRHLFYKDAGKHEFKRINMSEVIIDETNFSREVLKKIPVVFCETIHECYKGLVFVDGKFTNLLNPGTYYFLDVNNNVNVKIVDDCLKTLNIQAQEILTQDKVSVRFNVVIEYEFSDIVKAHNAVNNRDDILYNRAQLALRSIVSNKKLDEVLLSKEEISKEILNTLKEEANQLYLDIKNASIKDVILPGEIRNIMNMVLVAEKKAQASNITRREEIASTRSLLNTAKLMDENKTLYHLKELEYIERICANARTLNVGSGNILGQLTEMVNSDEVPSL